LDLAHKKNLEGLRINEWFRKPGNGLSKLPEDLHSLFSEEIWRLVEIECKNAGYIARQEQMIARTENMESASIPDGLDYNLISGLKKEASVRLNKIKPKTLGQASRVSGITPADIAVLTIWISKNESVTS
jgi:tRNA uridine 5-carboxymethylaminomethyl modification enzyme